jgi:histidinol dehydrogenase
MVKLLHSSDANFPAEFAAYLEYKPETGEEIRADVHQIISNIQIAGDDALIAYTEKFDKWPVGQAEKLRVSQEEIDNAWAVCPEPVRSALTLAAERIRAYHQRQMPSDFTYTDELGVMLGNRWNPIAAVGIYVPGGLASYPSSVLMNAIPAQVAGVARIAMVVPAPQGVLNPVILAAAHIAGITEIYKIGGAQAIAALAYGTDTIPKVDKIVGPGNAYVAQAKRELFGVVGIDMVAGPSEILVIADAKNNPDWIAADLLSQAEHDTQARSILITDDEAFGRAVITSVEAILPTLKREKIARESWENLGLVIIDKDFADTPRLANKIASEHVELAIDQPELLAPQITNAGALFLGRYTPEAIGDYVAGPSHVLPTSGTAAFSSGLSVFDFIKRSSIICCSAASCDALADATAILANAEGLGAHALSISLRKNGQPHSIGNAG